MNTRWILLFGVAFLAAGCGAGEPSEDEAASVERTAPERTAAEAAAPDTVMPKAPSPAPETMATATAAPEGREEWAGRLYTVQIAAFQRPDTAQGLARRMRDRDLPVWISQADVEGRTFNRVRVGASSSYRATQRLARWITQTYRWPVWIAPVDGSEPVPAGAIEATKAFLEQQ